MQPGERSARAFWVLHPGHGALLEEPLPAPAEGQVLVRALYSGISRGTESVVWSGRVPPSQYAAMRAPFQSGDFPGPVKYGYMSVGRIEEGPADRLGQLVFCLYPHQDIYWVPAAAAIPLPPGLPPERAILAANVETAVNAYWDAQPLAGDHIVVIGGGTVGLLTAWLCAQIPGSHVRLVDVNPQRRNIAARLGIGSHDGSVAGLDADLVIHASGQPAGLVDALNAAGMESTVLELSWYGNLQVAVPLGEAFHARRLVLRSSQVGRVPALRRARWSHVRRLRLALKLLCDERLNSLITGEDPFSRLPEVMARLATDPGDALCHRIRYP